MDAVARPVRGEVTDGFGKRCEGMTVLLTLANVILGAVIGYVIIRIIERGRE